MKSVSPYLNFPGTTEEAFAFYRSVFGGDYLGVVRFRDLDPEGTPEADLDKIAHIALPLAQDSVLMGTDALESQGQALTAGNSSYIMLEAESAGEAARLFDALAAGGRTHMPLQQTGWAERYGVCADRFGVQWMVNYTGGAGRAQGA